MSSKLSVEKKVVYEMVQTHLYMAIKRSEGTSWKIQILPVGKLEGFGFWLLSSLWSGMEFTAKTACHTPVK